jgi:hypothetical protein
MHHYRLLTDWSIELTDLKRRVGRDNLAELLTRCPYLKTAPQRTEKVAEWVARDLLA